MVVLKRETMTPVAGAAIYLLAGVLWIAFSDALLLFFTDDPAQLAPLQLAKGLFFILCTAAAFYYVLRAFHQQREYLHASYQGLVHAPSQYYWFAEPNGRSFQVGDGFELITGLSAQELDTTSWEQLIHPTDRERYLSLRRQALGKGEPYETTYRLRGRDGDYRHVFVREVPIRGIGGKIVRWVGNCTDITGYRLTERKLEVHQQNLRLAESIADISLWDWHIGGDRVRFSNRMSDQLGYEPGALSDSLEDFLSLVHPDDFEELEANIFKVIRGEETRSEHVFRMRHRSGEYRWFLTRTAPRFDEDGKRIGIIGANIDITEQKRNEERLLFLAYRDDVTGFYNRRYLREQLENRIGQTKTNGGNVGLIFLDIDHFKAVNDSVGHMAGDRVLCEAGERIESCLGAADIFCRNDGDDFVAVLQGVRDARRLADTANAVLKAFEQPFVVDGQHLYLTATIGGSLFPELASGADDLLRQADTAMRRGKREGRNCFVVVSPEMEEDARHWVTYKSAFQHALVHDEFYVEFQPIFDLNAGRFTAFEALGRWRSESLGNVPPNVFIPIAESAGLIDKYGNMMFAKAVAELADWRRQGHKELRLAVNVSARQLYHPDFIASLRRVVAAAGVPPEYIEIEITESVVMKEAEQGVAVLRELAGLGFRIAIDDFGTGYSSLNYLGMLDAHVLKIDKTFIDNVLINENDAKITKAVIALAKSLDMTVVAEGIETAEQLAFVRQHGCNLAQGYYFSRPVGAADVTGFLEGCELPSDGE